MPKQNLSSHLTHQEARTPSLVRTSQCRVCSTSNDHSVTSGDFQKVAAKLISREIPVHFPQSPHPALPICVA